MLSHASVVAHIIKCNPPKREGQEISQNLKAKNSTLLDSVVITHF